MGGEDYIYGGKGDDLLHAYSSDDVRRNDFSSGDANILGGYGADRIEGGKGDDVLRDQPGPGAGRPADVDFVNGGYGADTIRVSD